MEAGPPPLPRAGFAAGTRALSGLPASPGRTSHGTLSLAGGWEIRRPVGLSQRRHLTPTRGAPRWARAPGVARGHSLAHLTDGGHALPPERCEASGGMNRGDGRRCDNSGPFNPGWGGTLPVGAHAPRPRRPVRAARGGYSPSCPDSGIGSPTGVSASSVGNASSSRYSRQDWLIGLFERSHSM